MMTFLRLPVQASPLAVLFLCGLAVSLGRAHVADHRTPVMSFVVSVTAAGVAAWTIAALAQMAAQETVLTLAVILAAVLVAVLFIEARSLRVEDRSNSLLRHLAHDRSQDAQTFLQSLHRHPLVEGAIVVEAAELADLDSAVLARIFARCPVLKRGERPPEDGVEGDHIAHLFALFDASHILLAGDAPVRLVALSMPALATSPQAELELAVLQRMAQLLPASN